MALASPTPPEPHPAFDAVIWDYDGTLVATRGADEYAVDLLLARDATAAAGTEIFWATEGAPLEERIERAWPGRVAEIRPLFENDIGPVPFDGIANTLDALRQRGYRMAVVSSRRRRTLEWGLRVTQLRDYFGAVVGLDDVTEPKPAPEGLHQALRTIGAHPTRTVYVGDSEVDVMAGRRAGVTAWRATWARPPLSNDLRAPLLIDPADIFALIDAPLD